MYAASAPMMMPMQPSEKSPLKSSMPMPPLRKTCLPPIACA